MLGQVPRMFFSHLTQINYYSLFLQPGINSHGNNCDCRPNVLFRELLNHLIAIKLQNIRLFFVQLKIIFLRKVATPNNE